MTRIQAVLPILFVLLFGAGCATSLVLSGETLDAVGKQFVTVGHTYDAMYQQKQLTEGEYRTWATFADSFKVAYPKAVDLWKAAKEANDQESIQSLNDLVKRLRQRLTDFIHKLIGRLQPQGGAP